MNIKVLQANNGDSILITFKDSKDNARNILIDGGISETFGTAFLPGDLQFTLKQIKDSDQEIDLLIVTHIDDDHIGGILRVYENQELAGIIKNVWFNSGDNISNHFDTTLDPVRPIKLILDGNKKTSVKQGITLEKQISKLSSWERQIIKSGYINTDIPGCTIKVLSPNEKGLQKLNNKWETDKRSIKTSTVKKDYDKSLDELISNDKEELDEAIPNGSSIAILLEAQDKKILLLADAHPNVIVESLKTLGYTKENKLKVDLVKLSHHASKKNTGKDLLELIECDKYVISTDGSKHGLPNKTTLARVIKYQELPVEFFFNYDIADKIFSEEERMSQKFKVTYLNRNNISL